MKKAMIQISAELISNILENNSKEIKNMIFIKSIVIRPVMILRQKQMNLLLGTLKQPEITLVR